MYWFAAQQQTSTLRRQKISFFYVKFSAEFDELSFFYWKQQDVAKKWLKLKWSGVTPIGVTRSPRIKDFVRKCMQIRNFLSLWSNLLKKSLMENFIFSQC